MGTGWGPVRHRIPTVCILQCHTSLVPMLWIGKVVSSSKNRLQRLWRGCFSMEECNVLLFFSSCLLQPTSYCLDFTNINSWACWSLQPASHHGSGLRETSPTANQHTEWEHNALCEYRWAQVHCYVVVCLTCDCFPWAFEDLGPPQSKPQSFAGLWAGMSSSGVLWILK